MEHEISSKLTGRFVDDDDIVRTGRAMIEVDGWDFLHVPIPVGLSDKLKSFETAMDSRLLKSREDAETASSSADAASASASQAEESATSAKQDADRAASIADSTSWDGDRLTVNGKTSPSLRGPKGDRGEAGQDGKDGASAWGDISGKPDITPYLRNGSIVQRDENGRAYVAEPSSVLDIANKKYVDSVGNTKADKIHTHTSADIKDTTNDAGSSEHGGKVLVPRAKDGKIFYYSDPTEYRELARKGYVDSVGNTKADKSHTHTSADIEDAVSYFGYGSHAHQLVKTNSYGKIQVGSTPTGGSDVVPKSYVDALEARVDQRPALFSGSGGPPRYLTGARAGDWWLDETTMELYKITGV